MKLFASFFVAMACSAALAWFAAIEYAGWKRRAALDKQYAHWSITCPELKPAIIARIENPLSKLQRDDGIFPGPYDNEWHQCRGRGYILPVEEQAAFVERQRRQDARRDEAISKDIQRLLANPKLAECVLNPKETDCSRFQTEQTK